MVERGDAYYRAMYPREKVVSMLSAPTIELYHGTTTPIEVIKAKGLQAHSREAILDYLALRIRNSPYNLKRGKLLEIFPSLPLPSFEEAEWGVVKFTGIYDWAFEYATAPPEIIEHWLWEVLPKRLFKEAVTLLMEVSGGRILGKVITVEIPTNWIPELVEEGPERFAEIYDEAFWSLEEFVVLRSVPPGCIKRIDYAVPVNLQKILKEAEESHLWADEVIESWRGEGVT